MEKYRHYKVRGTNSIMLLVIFLILGVYSCMAQQKRGISIAGSETSFGMHRFFVEGEGNFLSNVYSFSNGLSTGIYAGNKLVNGRLRIGLYSTTAHFKGEVRILESDVLIDIYPLEFIRTHTNVLDVYLTTGVSVHSFSEKKPITRGYISTGEEGTIPSKTYQVAGVGLTYLPTLFHRTTSIFAEALFYNSISFAGNAESNGFVNVGIRKAVGRFKTKSN